MGYLYHGTKPEKLGLFFKISEKFLKNLNSILYHGTKTPKNSKKDFFGN
jgi:hypothetical protein